MSDLRPTIIPLNSGLDLSSPKMLAEPGSMLDCLNYELVDFEGYRRIDGFERYDGNVTIADLPNFTVYTGVVTTSSGSAPLLLTDSFFEDADGNVLGYIFSYSRIVPTATGTMRYIVFEGTTRIDGRVGSWEFKTLTGNHTQTSITQAELTSFENALRAAVGPLRATAVGLHWFRNSLFAVVPMLMVPYQASAANTVVDYAIGGTLTNTFSAGTATLLEKVVITPSSVSDSEAGYLVLRDLGTGSWIAPDNTFDLGGAVTVGAGSVKFLTGNLAAADTTHCSLWEAMRPNFYRQVESATPVGWHEKPDTYTTRVTLSGVTAEFNAVRRGGTTAASTYYFDDGSFTYDIVLLDYYVVSGSFTDGDAVVVVQFEYPGADIDSSFDLYTDSGATVKVADVNSRMTYNYLPGIPQLTEKVSRYQFRTSNFYATDGYDAVYAVNGAGRGFVFDQTYKGISFIYTQDDAELDIPRHVENHAEHLALGFQPGSVQLSVVGQPTNFSGLEGASELSVGDVITGLMVVEGTTLAVFCNSSIHSITGTTVDNFQTQVISPKSGCIEYSLANCGQAVYTDARGICTLETSANYGDFVNGRLSTKIFTKLRTKLRQGVLRRNNSAGIACALPIRDKNQYRLFFNDGRIVTMTLRGGDKSPGFTYQEYYLNASSTTDFTKRIVPFAWTSEVDESGVEKVFVSHYNADAINTSNYVYALESGSSFDGNYIPHYFTTNWYYSDNPSQFQQLHALRLYGLSKGVASLKVQAAGAQNDMYFSGAALSTTTTPINLPRVAADIVADFQDTTNRVDISARGLAIQLKFSGSNTTLSTIEPSHVAQVLVTYSSPDGAFDL